MKTTTLFTDILKDELAQRIAKNPKYSIRAFAKALKIHPGTLSAYLNGSRRLTAKSVGHLAKSLSLDTSRLSFDIQGEPQFGIIINSDFQKLAADQFDRTADWYHDAILELTRLKSFQPRVAWVAKVLGLGLAETQMAVERLERLGMLKRTKQGWKDVSHLNEIGTDATTSPALRRYQKQALKNSEYALEQYDKTVRDHSALMLTIASEDIPIYRDLIKKFRRDISAVAKANRNSHDSVYQLQVSMFPITQMNKMKENEK